MGLIPSRRWRRSAGAAARAASACGEGPGQDDGLRRATGLAGQRQVGIGDGMDVAVVEVVVCAVQVAVVPAVGDLVGDEAEHDLTDQQGRIPVKDLIVQPVLVARDAGHDLAGIGVGAEGSHPVHLVCDGGVGSRDERQAATHRDAHDPDPIRVHLRLLGQPLERGHDATDLGCVDPRLEEDRQLGNHDPCPRPGHGRADPRQRRMRATLGVDAGDQDDGAHRSVGGGRCREPQVGGELGPVGRGIGDDLVGRRGRESQRVGADLDQGRDEGQRLERHAGRGPDRQEHDRDGEPEGDPSPSVSRRDWLWLGGGHSSRSGFTVITSATRPSHSSRGASQYSSISFPSGSTVYRLLLTP